MSNVLLVAGSINPTTEVNREVYTTGFCACGSNVKFALTSEVSTELIDWSDFVLDFRPAGVLDRCICDVVRKSGRTYMIMLDDDLLNLPSMTKRNIKFLEYCLSKADVIFGSNYDLISFLTEKYSINRKVVIDIPVRPVEIIKQDTNNSITRFIYAAGANHEKPFEEYIAPAIEKLASNYPGMFNITFICVHPKISLADENNDIVDYVPGMRLNEYTEYMKTNRFDVGFAPLFDNTFCNGKYYNKFVEYSKVGIMGVYSNCKPYTMIIDNERNGLLVDNDINSWYAALEFAILNRQKVADIISEAQKELSERFSVDNMRGRIIEKIPEIVSEPTKKKLSAFLPFSFVDYVLIIWDTVLMCIEYINKNGFIAFCKGVSRHYKKYTLLGKPRKEIC